MTCSKKRVAWISAPGLISTDRFIVPEVSKHYIVDWYVIAKETESIDFENEIKAMTDRGIINCQIRRHKERNFEPGIIAWWVAFVKEIKAKDYDLIFEVMIGMPFYMPIFYHYLKNETVLVAIHNVRVPKGGTYALLNEFYVKYTINRFNYFHTFSKDQMNELLKFDSKKKCDYSPFVLMDYGISQHKKSIKEVVFLSFGFIREYKRIDVLIEAAQNTYEKIKIPFKVTIAGTCDNWEKYQKQIRIPELFNLMIRRIKDYEVPDLFAESDYFVAPYQDIAQSGSALIAINYNKPIIASKLPAFEEYIVDNKTGFLIKPADVQDLERVMANILLNHEKIFNKLIATIKTYKESHFTASKVAKDYIRNFEEVMKDQKHIN